MSEWSGFTDADLRKMKLMSEGESDVSGPKIVKPITGGRPKPGNIGQKVQKRQNMRSAQKGKPRTPNVVPPNAMLSKSQPKVCEEQTKLDDATSQNEQIPLHGKTAPPLFSEEDKPIEKEEAKAPEIVEDTDVIKEKEKLKLEDIQRRQKEMEEKNRRKKTMLTKAIAERKKKAFAESHKLLKIQSELSKLDEMLNYDVSIVRDKIDVACHEYNAAQKRFEKAEAEYVEAKMSLHRTTELKEDLTEHLYKLIQLNEERKANKLEKLMQQLELEESEEIEAVENTEAPVQNSTTPEQSSSIEVNPGNEIASKKDNTEDIVDNVEKLEESQTSNDASHG